jgi:formimidoylglutamate deiminase
MLAEAARQTPASVRSEYAETFRELRAAGYTAVGEFHYLGLEEALAAVDAAAEAGIVLVLLFGAYERGGLPRFRHASVADYLHQVEGLRARGLTVGVAPHSVRACSEAWLSEIGRYAAAERLMLHVHADEQPREVEESLVEHGLRPIEVLARAGCLSPQTTVVHATEADDRELDLLAATGAHVCLCPTTEASLGDGFAPVARLRSRGIPLCIGSDSNVRIDPLEELRELDGIARRTAGTREAIGVQELLAIGGSAGAAAIGVESWPEVSVDLGHRALRGVALENVPGALVSGCGSDVFLSSGT